MNRWDFDSHKREALRENVEFLRGTGLDLQEIAVRLDMKYGALRDMVTEWEKEEQ